jgi:hypothetical protein
VQPNLSVGASPHTGPGRLRLNQRRTDAQSCDDSTRRLEMTPVRPKLTTPPCPDPLDPPIPEACPPGDQPGHRPRGPPPLHRRRSQARGVADEHRGGQALRREEHCGGIACAPHVEDRTALCSWSVAARREPPPTGSLPHASQASPLRRHMTRSADWTCPCSTQTAHPRRPASPLSRGP